MRWNDNIGETDMGTRLRAVKVNVEALSDNPKSFPLCHC